MDAPERPVVADTTPIINLVGVDLLDLLPQLYGAVWIAEAVSHEYVFGRRPRDPELSTLSWLRIVRAVAPDPSLPKGLGRGEAATISVASMYNARAVLLDEQLARRLARQRKLPVVGTMGVLLAAKQSGLLRAVRPVIDAMIVQGRHISPALRTQVLQIAGEEE